MGGLALTFAFLPAYFTVWSFLNGPLVAAVFLGWMTVVLVLMGSGILAGRAGASRVTFALFVAGCEMLVLAGYLFVTYATLGDAGDRRQIAGAVFGLSLGGLLAVIHAWPGSREKSKPA